VTGRQYGTVGVVGVVVFALSVVALHILDTDVSVVNEPISIYSLGEYGWLSQAGTIAMGVGLIGIALGLRGTLMPGKRVTASWALMLIGGLGFIISGLFVPDPTGTTEATTSGTLHDVGGYVSMLSVLASVWMLRGVFSRDAPYRSFANIQMWFAVLVTASMVAFLALGEQQLGLMQRVFVVIVVVWLLVLGVRTRRTQAPVAAASAA
jgi:hypothetical protein